MKYHHKLNFILSGVSALLGILLNYFDFGNLVAAIFIAGPVTFVIGLMFNYGVDWIKCVWNRP